MSEAKNFDIFNLGVNDVDVHNEEKKGVSDLYSPKADDGNDGVYKALIRFLPNPKNPSKSLLRKYVYWLEDDEGNGSYYDSPSTIGEKCPVQDLFFKLRNSDSAVDRGMSDKLKRRNVFYSLIQIIDDKQNPDLNGQIKVLKYGWQVKKKIDEELNPEFSEPTQVFDLFEGKNFEFIITKQAGFNNYDSSKFQGSRSALSIDGTAVERTPDSQSKVIEHLNNAPDLDQWDYKAWDEATRSKVMNVLAQYTSPGSNIGSVVNSTKASSDSVLDELTNTTAATTEAAPTKTEAAPVAEGSDAQGEDLNKFLDGLDL